MRNQVRPAVVSVLALTLLLGVAYPLAVTAVSQVIAPDAANGSLVRADGVSVGHVRGFSSSAGPSRTFGPGPH